MLVGFRAILPGPPMGRFACQSAPGGLVAGGEGEQGCCDFHVKDDKSFNAEDSDEQTYGITFGYNRTWSAKSDALPLPADDGFHNGEPAFDFFTTETGYTPFGKQNSPAAPWLNPRFAVHAKFNGGDRNYEDRGRNASDNNTLYFNTWLNF